MKAQEFQAHKARTMSEVELQNCVIEMAKRMGYLVFHTYDSRRSSPGYPDLHLVHPRAGRHMFWELKTARGRVSIEQRGWLDALAAAGCDVAVVRPSDYQSGWVLQQLRSGRDERG